MKNKITLLAFFLLTFVTAHLFFEVKRLTLSLDAFQDEIVTSRLIVVDKANNPKAVVDAEDSETTLTILDSTNVPRFQIALDSADNMNVFMFDGEGKPRVGYFSQTDNTFLQYKNKVENFKPVEN
ncbi:hypothetical protein [Alteromonas sp. P256]|uniref:hypothetical protein n=1 Tax=Alteromonas sp. P256 TaxID=3117399 RepID=UPI002FDF2B5E